MIEAIIGVGAILALGMLIKTVAEWAGDVREFLDDERYQQEMSELSINGY